MAAWCLRSVSKLEALFESIKAIFFSVSSFNSKMDLLKLKQFDRVIIDEASQLLEPYLVGLLPHFKRFVLIGDHQQLPAVVTQSVADSAVADEDLQSIGLHNLRNSLFERLYKRCIENDWDWAYAQLSHQGRMHADIMKFPVLSVNSGDSILELAQKMITEKPKVYPVLDENGFVVGTINRTEVLNAIDVQLHSGYTSKGK